MLDRSPIQVGEAEAGGGGGDGLKKTPTCFMLQKPVYGSHFFRKDLLTSTGPYSPSKRPHYDKPLHYWGSKSMTYFGIQEIFRSLIASSNCCFG